MQSPSLHYAISIDCTLHLHRVALTEVLDKNKIVYTIKKAVKFKLCYSAPPCEKTGQNDQRFSPIMK